MLDPTKRSIVLDFDDTLVKSSEQIVRMINQKYHTNKNIEHLSEWDYSSIYPGITKEEIMEFYGSNEFFNNVELNDGVKEFVTTFSDKFNFIVCSKGDKRNIRKKRIYCDKLFFNTSYQFIGLSFKDEQGFELNKSEIDFSDCIFCVDDNISSMASINTPKKILIKNYHEYYWNRTPKNLDNIYVINSFYDLIDMCKFDYQNLERGIRIG